MHVKRDSNSLKLVKNVVANAWGFDYDTENLVPNPTPIEELEEAPMKFVEEQPYKVLRRRHYGPPPLTLRPDYSGDYIQRIIKEFKNRCADFYDIDGPDDLLNPGGPPELRDVRDQFYEYNRPDEWEGGKTLKDYHDRGWDPEDAPEISEDKILRMRSPKNIPIQKFDLPKVKRVINAFLSDVSKAHIVVARFLLNFVPEIDLGDVNVHTAVLLSDLEKSLIYTKAKGWRKPDALGVSVRLRRAEPRSGRWTFYTTSGGPVYSTIFQFVPEGRIRDAIRLPVRVSCSCPSWLFWGAQYNAVMQDYLYGKIRPKFTPPVKRDPTGRFLVCKHVLACIPVVSKYRTMIISPKVKERLRGPLKVEIKEMPKEKLRIPTELKNFAKRDDIREAVKKWEKMSDKNREDFIMGLDSPGAVAFMAHRFPETSTEYVVYKLKDLATKARSASHRQWARRLLRGIT